MGSALLMAMLALAEANEPYRIDPVLTERVQAQARSYGLEYRVVVAVVPSWKAQGKVQVETRFRGGIVAILVSPILYEEMDGGAFRAMFAHELAHTLRPCGLRPYTSIAEHNACEHAADAQAAAWVGKREVLRGLCQVRAIGWDWRYNTDATPMNERIRLLHNRTDIR
ncbi:MAG: hypothetical protein IT406_03660 [Candidatus Yanofskybacteria bacterium]|nr:hypothetical protein [Candidatus Yanofskybacteria bacterium]